MRISRSLFLALSLLALPVAASAEGPATEAPKATVAVQPAVAPEATRAPEMKLKEIKLQDRQQDKARPTHHAITHHPQSWRAERGAKMSCQRRVTHVCRAGVMGLRAAYLAEM